MKSAFFVCFLCISRLILILLLGQKYPDHRRKRLYNMNETSEEIEQLIHIRTCNNRLAWMLSDYINNSPQEINTAMIEEFEKDYELPHPLLYQLLLSNFCGLDTDNNEDDKYIATNYLRESITPLSAETYRQNDYYEHIIIPQEKSHNWQFTTEHYQPYEAFVCRDITLCNDFKEIPHIGYFEEPFEFPVVEQNGREWMAIKPNEIETMRLAISQMQGNIVTFGLGLGYFTYMASQKEEVEHITVVEMDEEVIQLFNTYILPQFNHPEKVEIIRADAFDYIQHTLPTKTFNHAFVDLWHDVSDGLDMYLHCKRMEHLALQTHFLYWIEESLLSGLRWKVFDQVITNDHSIDEIKYHLSNKYLKKLAEGIR